MVGVASPTFAEEFPFGTWLIPWNDGIATIEIQNEFPDSGIVVVTYSWDGGKNGVCAQARLQDSVLTLAIWDETVIVLRASENELIGEKYSITRLQKVSEEKEETR